MADIFKYIKANNFFADYADNIPAWKKKVSGKNSNGNPVEFSKEEMRQIKKGLKQLFKDLIISLI